MALKPSCDGRSHLLPWGFESCDQAIQSKSTILAPPPQSYLKSLNRKRAPSKWDDAEKWLICCDNSSLSCIHKLSLPLARSNLHNLDLPHVRKGIYESTRDLVSKKDLSDRVHESSSVNTMSSLHFLDDNASNYNGSDHDHVSEVYHARHSHAMTMIENPTMKPTMKPSRNNDSCERSRQQHRILQNLERKCVSLCNVRSRSILEEIEPTLSRSIGADEQGSQHKDQHFRHGVSMERGHVRRKSTMKDVGIEVSPSLSRRDVGTQVTTFPSFITSSSTSPTQPTGVHPTTSLVKNTILDCVSPTKPHESMARVCHRHNNTPIRRSTPHCHGRLKGNNKFSTITNPSYFEFETCPIDRLGLLSSSISIPIEPKSTKLDGIGSNTTKPNEEEVYGTKKFHSTSSTLHKCSCDVKDEGVDWEEGERAKLDAKYKFQEAKIKAWVNLKRAKANAELKQLELKVERLRSEATEKAMRKVARAHMKAEEMRKVVEAQHAQRLRKVTTKEKESPFPKCFGSVLCIKKMIYTK